MERSFVETPGFRLLDFVKLHAEKTPSAPALAFAAEEPWSYGTLYANCKDVQNQVKALGFAGVGRIAVVLPKNAESVVVMLALASEASCLLLDPLAGKDEIIYSVRATKSRMIITSPNCQPALRAAEEEGLPALVIEPGLKLVDASSAGVRPDAADTSEQLDSQASPIAFLFLTSGTTSRSKIVPFTHRQIGYVVMERLPWLSMAASDRTVHMWVLNHIAGWGNYLLPIFAVGGWLSILPEFQINRFMEAAVKVRPTFLNAPPLVLQSIMEYLSKHPELQEVFSAMRFISTGGIALTVPLTMSMEDYFKCPVLQAYGMTETFGVTTSNPMPPAVRKPASVGVPYPGIKLKLLDGNALVTEPGKTGEVCIRGDSIFSGYLGNPELNEKAFTDGWFRTGDIGCYDEDGYIFLKGRINDLISRGGEKIAPMEVDEAVRVIDGIKEAACFPIPHVRLGADIACAVVKEPGHNISSQDIRNILRQRLVHYKVPNRIIFVDSIPKVSFGKVRRNELYNYLLENYPHFFAAPNARPASDQLVEPRNEMETKLVELWREILNFEDIGVEDDFFAFGGDSLQATELLAAIEERLGHSLPASILIKCGTIAQLADYIKMKSELEELVEIRGEGTKTPLFCIHALDGDVMSYRNLAPYLGDDQPIYSLRFSLTAGHAYTDISQLATHYIGLIKSVSEKGPYLILGHSLGGMIAYEIAQQLMTAGDEVSMLVLVDTSISPNLFASQLKDKWNELLRIPWNEKGEFVYERVRKEYRRVKKRMLKQQNAVNVLNYCARNYRPVKGDKHIPRVILFRSLEGFPADSANCDITLGWGQFIEGNLNVEKVPGNHYSMMVEPHVRVLAGRLGQYIAAVSETRND